MKTKYILVGEVQDTGIDEVTYLLELDCSVSLEFWAKRFVEDKGYQEDYEKERQRYLSFERPDPGVYQFVTRRWAERFANYLIETGVAKTLDVEVWTH